MHYISRIKKIADSVNDQKIDKYLSKTNLALKSSKADTNRIFGPSKLEDAGSNNKIKINSMRNRSKSPSSSKDTSQSFISTNSYSKESWMTEIGEETINQKNSSPILHLLVVFLLF